MFFYLWERNFAFTYLLSDLYDDLYNFWLLLSSIGGADYAIQLLRSYIKRFPTLEDRKKLHKDLRSGELDLHPGIRLFLLNRMSFSGTIEAGGFSASAGMDRLTESSIDRLEGVHRVLRDSRIFLRHASVFDVLADEMSSPANPSETFVYLDPPYITAKKLYGRNGELHDFDHKKLAEMLRNAKFDFLMSYDDCEEVKELYSWANISFTDEIAYGMSNGKRKRELIITNYGREVFICS